MAILRYPVIMSCVMILGVPIDPVTRKEATSLLLEMTKKEGQHHVMTPNNEMLVEASKNPAFKELLNRTELNLPDTTGLIFAARMTGQQLPQRVPGVDAVTDLCLALGPDTPVFFLGAQEGVAEKAAFALKARNPNLTIAGCFSGSPSDANASAIIDMINASGAHILFVAFGAPAQDMWIDAHLKETPSVRLAIGVGGTFDFIAGHVKRAPGFMRKTGLEWAWRLLLQPSRWKRIITAVIVFPYLVLRSRFRHEAAR